jgi:hypothetical protein
METQNKEYNVTVSHVAYVKGHVTIKASSEEEAESKAIQLANSGDVEWVYDGLSEVFDPEVVEVR